MMDCRLQGGLDHIERTKNQIKIFDIGISTGSIIHDQSCIIRRLK
jgi:hypothetical protein